MASLVAMVVNAIGQGTITTTSGTGLAWWYVDISDVGGHDVNFGYNTSDGYYQYDNTIDAGTNGVWSGGVISGYAGNLTFYSASGNSVSSLDLTPYMTSNWAFNVESAASFASAGTLDANWGNVITVVAVPEPSSATIFMEGFAFVFAAGLMGTGARWVRKILGGTGESCEEV